MSNKFHKMSVLGEKVKGDCNVKYFRISVFFVFYKGIYVLNLVIVRLFVY